MTGNKQAAADALAAAERDMELGFTDVAVAHALISIAHMLLGDKEVLDEARSKVVRRTRTEPGSASTEQHPH